MLHSFEEDPRTSSQLEADLDCVDVTISMYAVDDRRGERKARSVFRAEREDWTAVMGTYRQFKEESGFSSLGMPSYEEAGEVWVVTDKPSGAGVLLIAGAAEVHRTSNGGQLAWIWVHPLRRGSKKKYTLWLANRLRDEYGTLIPLFEDMINGDITPAGIRFLDNHFPTPQA